MIPKKAIERAVEGGWKDYKKKCPEGLVVECNEDGIAYRRRVPLEPGVEGVNYRLVKQWHNLNRYEIALDSTFWQALGKVVMQGREKRQKGMLIVSSPTGIAIERKVDWAEYTAHRFYDEVLTGGDLEVYWNDILK